MYLVLKDLDSPETSDIARYILEVLFGRPNTAFFDMLEASRDDVYTLVESEEGDINYFGFTFERAVLGSNFNEKCG
jgi:hypothetical protein